MADKEFVKSIYPNAFLLIDSRYSETKYIILSKPIDVLNFAPAYTEIMIGVWNATEKTAWNKARRILEEKLIRKLEV
jgi:hypothetical protein